MEEQNKHDNRDTNPIDERLQHEIANKGRDRSAGLEREGDEEGANIDVRDIGLRGAKSSGEGKSTGSHK